MNSTTSGSALRLIANISMVIVVLLVGVLALQAHFFGRRTLNTTRTAGIEKGKTISHISGFDSGSNSRKLAIFLSANCIHCKNSSPFYKKLLAESEKMHIQESIVAVFPEAMDEAKDFLDRYELPVRARYNADFSAIGIAATPTIVLLEGDKISDYWVGELEPELQRTVFSGLGLSPDAAAPSRRIANVAVDRSANVFDDEHPELTISPNIASESEVQKYIGAFDVDGQGFIYLGAGTSITRYSPGGQKLVSIDHPTDAIGPFCADIKGNLYVPMRGHLTTYGSDLTEQKHIEIPEILGDNVRVLRMSHDQNQDFLYIHIYNTQTLEQSLYRLETNAPFATRLLHNATKPFRFSPYHSPGAFDFVAGRSHIYVSDIYEYKIYVYSAQTGKLERTFSKPFVKEPVYSEDGRLKNLHMTVGGLGRDGAIDYYPPILHLSLTGAENLLVWTNRRDPDFRQVVEVYDRNLKFLGNEVKFTDPGLDRYVFANSRVYAPYFEQENGSKSSWISPLDLPGKPFSLRIYKDLTVAQNR